MCHFALRALVASALVLSAIGCGSATESPAAPTEVPTGGCAASETRCAGLQVETCDVVAGRLAWSAPRDCGDGQVCRNGTACTDLTADEVQRVDALSALFAESRTKAALSTPVDHDAAFAKFRVELLTGDGSPRAYVQTMWNALMSLPQGHQALWPAKLVTDADTTAAMSVGFNLGPVTVYGACMSPFGDHAVVTVAPLTGPLRRGDEVVAIDGKRGSELQALVMSEPDAVDLIPPTPTGRFAFAIRSFLGRDRKGTVLTVRRGGTGAESNVTLPEGAPMARAYSCADPFARDASLPASASVLPDGTGLLYLPAFAQKTVAEFEAQVGPEIDKVKDAPRLVIDLRGNFGGNLGAALDLVAQLPDAKKAEYCEFFERTPDAQPAAYTSRGRRAVDPAKVGAARRLAYEGRVALLVDGATFSSGEHLVLAARASAHVLVIGTKTAGSYGSTNDDVPRDLPGTPALQVTVNRSQVRTLDGKALDGTSQEPDIVVEYEPAAIAAGVDPMVQRAITELSK